ncbi:MAG: response regulator [Leptospiraceae bacterium]|nr:response regulator [Leptospiraceae bacterium]MCP5497311.1 response regulator [Leptospiraceae bacterium]
MNKKILIVDDIQSIKIAIKDLLSKEYTVFDASNYEEAIKTLENESIDLVITDIRMPGKSGLDLIKTIKENYPSTLYALITAYNINDYIQFAKEHGVWNIIPKYSFLDLRYIEVTVRKLMTSDIFGVEKYFDSDFVVAQSTDEKFEKPPEKGIVIKTIKSDKDRTYMCERIAKFMIDKGAPRLIQQVLEELTSNAMIRAPKDQYGVSKYQYEIPAVDMIIPYENIKLSEKDYFQIGYGIYDKTYILIIQDNFGTLKKEEILRRLDRHISVNEETGLPNGLSDSHGRGLYICREISDTIIFNIRVNVQTEIISLIKTGETRSFKSLSIYETG